MTDGKKVKLLKVQHIQGYYLHWGKDKDGKPCDIKVGETVECQIPALTEALLSRGYMHEAEGRKWLDELKAEKAKKVVNKPRPVDKPDEKETKPKKAKES